MKRLFIPLAAAMLTLIAACSAKKASPETAALAASLQDPGIILIDFTAKGNADCEQMKPIVETALAKYGDRIRHVPIDTTEHKIIADAYYAVSVPYFVLVHDNTVITNHFGALSSAEFGKWLDTYVPKR